MEQIIYAGILVKNSEGKVLLVKKPADAAPYGGMYTVPCSVIKAGESADNVAQRALADVTNCQAANIKRILFDDEIVTDGQKNQIHQIILFYTGDLVGDAQPAPTASRGIELIWVSPSEIKGLPLSSPLQKLFALVGTWKKKFIFPVGLYVMAK